MVSMPALLLLNSFFNASILWRSLLEALYSYSQQWYNELIAAQKNKERGINHGNHSGKKDKKKYLDLLLLADEQEDMVDRYLERGDMFVLTDGTVRAECGDKKKARHI